MGSLTVAVNAVLIETPVLPYAGLLLIILGAGPVSGVKLQVEVIGSIAPELLVMPVVTSACTACCKRAWRWVGKSILSHPRHS